MPSLVILVPSSPSFALALGLPLRRKPPVGLWDDMLELLYTGNAREAWALFEQA